MEVNTVRDLVKKVSLSNGLDAAKPKAVPDAPVIDPPVIDPPAQSSTNPLQGVLGALRNRFQGLQEPIQAPPLTPMASTIKDAAIKAVTPTDAGAAEMPQQMPRQDYTSALSLLEKGLPGALVKNNKPAVLDRLKQAPNNAPTANQGVPPEVIALIKVGQEVAASNPAAAEQIKTLLARVTSGEPLSEQEQKLMQLVLQRANKG